MHFVASPARATGVPTTLRAILNLSCRGGAMVIGLRYVTWLLAASLAGLTAGSLSAPAQAQATRYAVLSAVGDQLTVVHARSQTGSRLDQNERDSAAMPDNSLDRLVLKQVDAALRRQGRSVETAALAAANAPIFALQRETLGGRQPNDAAVKRFASALPEGGADRLLLVLKSRGDVRIPVSDGTIGLGRLEGLGFYVDSATILRSGTTGREGTGFIAPYAYLRVVLADAQGNVIAEQPLNLASTYPLADAQHAAKAWEVLDASDKYDALEKLLAQELGRTVQAMLAAHK
jgi:hypothetical protein